MKSHVEQIISQSLRVSLRDLLIGASISDSEQFQNALSGLEFFLPQVFREIYPEWRKESLDGILPILARKLNVKEAEIFGLCILLSDQTVTPVYLKLQLAETNGISWLECRLGERGKDGMVRIPYSLKTISKQLIQLQRRFGQIDWVYKITFGQRATINQC